MTEKQDRPDREEVTGVINTFLEGIASKLGKGEAVDLEKVSRMLADQILALFDEEETRKQIEVLREALIKMEKKLDDREIDLIEAKREERERIYEKLADDFDEVAVLLAGHELLAQTQYKIAFQGFGKLIGSWLRQALKQFPEGG